MNLFNLALYQLEKEKASGLKDKITGRDCINYAYKIRKYIDRSIRESRKLKRLNDKIDSNL